MATLKNCPFCGGSVTYSNIPGHGFSIVCPRCGALAMHARHTDAAHLGATWNLRRQRHNFNQKNATRPCPFCAARANLKTMPQDGSILVCEACGMMVSFATIDDAEKTIAAWNRRA